MHLSKTALLSLALSTFSTAKPLAKKDDLPMPMPLDSIESFKDTIDHEMHDLDSEMDDDNEDEDEDNDKPEVTSIHASFATTTTIVPTASTPTASTSPSGNATAQVKGGNKKNHQTCPPVHPSKQCCTSVSSLADQLTGANGLGDVLPWAQGIQVSSLIGLQCTSPFQFFTLFVKQRGF